jgi:hypothetical protein
MNTLKEHEQLLKRRALRKQLKNEQRMPQSNGGVINLKCRFDPSKFQAIMSTVGMYIQWVTH